MLRFAANLSLLFQELPYLDRFSAAAEAGFEAVEILFPYELAAKDTRRALLAHGLELVLINAPPPSYAGKERGFAAVPGLEDRFRYDLRRALRYAGELRAGTIHLMAGATDAPEAMETFVANLRHACDEAPNQRFTIEPLNQKDQPGYALSDFDLGAEIVARVDRPNLGLQYDSYHAQVIHGDALAVWERVRPHVTHVQIGDAPNRTEPGSGEIDFTALFAAIEASGYDGWISAEYHPTTRRTDSSLGWKS